MASARLEGCGRERADDVHRLTQVAFAPFASLDPPSSAGRESLADVIADLDAGGGAIAELDGHVVGCLRWRVQDDGDLSVKRVAVEPEQRRAGVGAALLRWAEDEARRRGCPGVAVDVRLALPGNRAFFERLGFGVVAEHRHDGYDHPTYVSMRKPVDSAARPKRSRP